MNTSTEHSKVDPKSDDEAASAKRPKNTRTKTPTVLQMESTECGAASLAMILAYYGAWIPLEELREACGVSRDGSKASNLLKGARKYGLNAKGFKKDRVERLRELPTPSIIHWNFNHFVVFEGFTETHAYLNDPASGPRKVGLEEMEESFTGVVLAFEPGEAFKTTRRPPGVVQTLAKRLSGSTGVLALVLIASLALIVPGIAIAGFSAIFVDRVLVAQTSDWLIPLAIGMVITAVFRGALTWIQQHYLLRLETGLALSMASRFLWRMIQLPMSFFQQRHVGELTNRMAANDRVASLLSGQLATNAFNLAMIVFYAATIAVFDVWLAVIAIALASTNVLALWFVDRHRDDANRALQGDNGKLMAVTVGTLRAAETVKASGMEQTVFEKWAGAQAKVLRGQRELGFSTALLSAFPVLMNALTMAAILGVGGMRVMEGALSVGEIVAIQSLMASFTKPIAALVRLGDQLQRIRADLERLDDIESYEPAPERGAKQVWEGPAVLSGKLEICDLHFGYSPMEPPLLKGVSLELAPGARVALVGGSGSGKTTLGRLVAGVLSPWEGSIRLDGYDLLDIPPQTFASSVAYVDQDIFLFSGSVRDNLTLWDQTVSEAALTRALKDAMLYDDVMSRSGQYHSQLEEDGVNLSGGQRQRMEIARALVGSPSLLVLDEATAALDAQTEKMIDDNLRRRGCACLIIAHRLSTIRDCDEIIVLERGRVVERGTHETLMAAKGKYARLMHEGEGYDNAA